MKHARICRSHVPERELSTTDYIRREAMESPTNELVVGWLVGGTKQNIPVYNICIEFRNRISFASTTLNVVEWKEQRKMHTETTYTVHIYILSESLCIGCRM